MRIGFGYDVHRLVFDRKLILGGVCIPYEKGLAGHSDADVLVHSIMDAMLGALAMGDIGKHFPDNDQNYKDIDSMVLLEKVMVLIWEKGYTIGNIDTTICAEKPKMQPYISQMQKNIADVLKTVAENISIKATTTEKLGFVGAGEGISAYAVVLLEKVIATNNKGKLKEFNKIFESLGIECVSLRDMGINIEVAETESTFLGNARLKAKEIYKIAKMPTVSDDSGLLVDALSGGPGVYSARYAGDECNDDKNIEKLLSNMAHITNRNAVFKSVVYAILDDETELYAEGICKGEILFEKIGSNGFGYDPVFYVREFDKSVAQLTDEEKNSISHRGRAIKQLKEKLSEAFGRV